MQSPSLKEIDEIRKAGYRPQVVGCFLKDKEVLFLFKKEHELWQFPQGGIDNHETAEEAIFREMGEELGDDFINGAEIDSVIGRSAIDFPKNSENLRELRTDDGIEMVMKGKEYFFMAINASKKDLDIKKTEFDEYEWADYDKALEVCEMIYQKGKRRITIDALGALHEQNLL